MLQAGVDAFDAETAERLERAYYALMRLTSRHFGQPGDGWHLMGVAGFDTPTMNRAVVASDEPGDVDAMVEDAVALFGARDAPWAVVLPTFRPTLRWHAELIARGFALTSSLHVLVLPDHRAAHGARPPFVREMRLDEAPRFTNMLLDVFQMPRRFYAALADMTEAWQAGGVRHYFAEVDGRPAATGCLAVQDGVAGIYNVGTQRGRRRQGLARAVMSRLLDDGREADVVTLQVAPGGVAESFYLRLGFRHVYTWRFYTPGPRVGGSTRWKASPG